MKKKLIMVASPPACGKTYVSELIAKTVGHVVCLDKDDLRELVEASFAAAGQPFDMDSEFYRNNLRDADYATVLNIAYSTLRFEDIVLANSPFGREVRSIERMRAIKEKANALGAELMLIWVTAPPEVAYERMKKRNSDRDTLKLQNWEEFVKKQNFTPPYELEESGAVDKFIVFDSADDATFNASFEKTMQLIME